MEGYLMGGNPGGVGKLGSRINLQNIMLPVIQTSISNFVTPAIQQLMVLAPLARHYSMFNKGMQGAQTKTRFETMEKRMRSDLAGADLNSRDVEITIENATFGFSKLSKEEIDRYNTGQRLVYLRGQLELHKRLTEDLELKIEEFKSNFL